MLKVKCVTTELIDVRKRSVTDGPKLNNHRVDHGIDILQVDAFESLKDFRSKYEDSDETGPEPFFDSMEIYYPEEQMLIVADITLTQPRKEFAFTPIKAEVVKGSFSFIN